jgi:hypothetical protein
VIWDAIVTRIIEYRLYAMLGFVMVMACSGWLYRTQYAAWQNARFDIAQLQRQRTIDARLIAAEPQLQREYATLRARYHEDDETITTIQARFLRDLQAICRRHSVALSALDFSPSQGRGAPVTRTRLGATQPGDPPQSGDERAVASAFVEIPAHLTLTGSYRDVLATLASISGPPYFAQALDPALSADPHGVRMSVDILILRPSSKNGGAPGQGERS